MLLLFIATIIFGVFTNKKNLLRFINDIFDRINIVMDLIKNKKINKNKSGVKNSVKNSNIKINKNLIPSCPIPKKLQLNNPKSKKHSVVSIIYRPKLNIGKINEDNHKIKNSKYDTKLSLIKINPFQKSNNTKDEKYDSNRSLLEPNNNSENNTLKIISRNKKNISKKEKALANAKQNRKIKVRRRCNTLHKKEFKKKIKLQKKNMELIKKLNNVIDNTFFYKNLIKSVDLKQRYIYLTDFELNSLKYKYAKSIDTRAYFQYYWSLIKTKHILIVTFFNNKDYNLFILKISILITSFAIHFTLNEFFFTHETMHKIYIDQGIYKLIYNIPFIIFSSICGSALCLFLKKLAQTRDDLLKLKYYKHIEFAKNEVKNIYKWFKIKFILYAACGLICMLFCWYYTSAFCSVYKNTQSHLFKSFLLSYALSMIYPFLFYLIPGFFRIQSLEGNNNKKNKECLYNTSKLIAFI